MGLDAASPRRRPVRFDRGGTACVSTSRFPSQRPNRRLRGNRRSRRDGLPLETAPPDWPALTLQMLFYGPESGRSFVQINGRNYRVGERLDDGPEVLEIAPHGVILAYQGKKVLVAMDR